MRSKAYNIALAALISLLTFGAANAQDVAPVPPVPAARAVRPVKPVAPLPNVTVITSGAYAPVSGLSGQYAYVEPSTLSYGGSNVYIINGGDSTYRNKMQKLQEQMHALSKEMTELSTDERKKNNEQVQLKMAEWRKLNSARFDSAMTKSFGQTFAYRANADRVDNNLEKQVQSGEVKEKTKTFSKSYSVDANDMIQIDNNYGKVAINTWDKKEVKVDVDIKAYALEDADAQKLLDQTVINSAKDGNTVSFKTDINRESNSWWGTMTQNGKTVKMRKVVINYTVYMPAKAALNLSNKYGAVSLPDLGGKLNIKTMYGGLVAKTLSNNGNVIVVNYGDANIGSMTGSQVKVTYGSLALDQADDLNATVISSPVKIGKLNSSGVIDLRYGGGLVINDLGKSLKTLNINSTYAPVKLNSVSDTNADFDVTTHYGDFMYDNTTSVTSQTPEKKNGFTTTKNYKGHVGKGNTDKTITVNSNYSSVKFD